MVYINYHTSKLFDWKDVWQSVEQWRTIQEYKNSQRELREANQGRDGTRADWYRDNWKSDAMLVALKVAEKWGEGGRNTLLWSYATFLQKDVGLTSEEVSDAIFWINANSSDPLEEIEITRTICKSLRLPF